MGVGSYCEGEVVRTGQYSIQQLKRVEILKQIQLPMIIQSHVISKTYKLCSPQQLQEQEVALLNSPAISQPVLNTQRGLQGSNSPVFPVYLRLHHWATGPPSQRVKYLHKAKHLLGALRPLQIHNLTVKRLCNL